VARRRHLESEQGEETGEHTVGNNPQWVTAGASVADVLIKRTSQDVIENKRKMAQIKMFAVGACYEAEL